MDQTTRRKSVVRIIGGFILATLGIVAASILWLNLPPPHVKILPRLSEWLGLLGFFLCLFILGYGFFTRPASTVSVRRLGRTSTLLFGLLVLSSLWIWLRSKLGLVLYMLWGILMDDDPGSHPQVFTCLHLALVTGISSLFAWFVVWRILTGRASGRYIRVLLGCSVALLAIHGSIKSYDIISRIDGTDAKEVAESCFKRTCPNLVGEGAYLVEQPRPIDLSPSTPYCKNFVILTNDEPRGRIYVCPYYHFWWTINGISTFPSSTELLDRAKACLRVNGDLDRAKHILLQITENFPQTRAAVEANGLLDSLNSAQATAQNKSESPQDRWRRKNNTQKQTVQDEPRVQPFQGATISPEMGANVKNP